MKKRLMASLLTLCMLLTLLPATALAAGTGAFTDVAEDAWYYDEVQFVKNEGLMNGVGGSQFGPELTVTRAMMVTILWRMAGSPKAEGTQFTDVAAGQYYADAALWACANGIANGCGDSTFKPDNAITREQMAAFMYRYADYKGYDMDADGDLSKFSDASAVSEYAEAAMAWANAEGLITGMGDGTLAPQGSATRAQIAAILYRFCTLLEGGSDVDGEYTVTFEWNYSDEGTYKTVTVKAGETVDKPTNPRRSGYSFSGWYTKAQGGEKFDFDTEIDEDVTLYAHWTKSSGSSHTHSWGDWTANGDGTHTRVCTKNSNHTETEKCTLKGYEHCPDCGWTDGKYHISTAEELTAFAAAVNGGESFSGEAVVLDADVDLADVEWTPIGNGTRSGKTYTGNAFKGEFDGKGHTISNVKSSLFGIVDGGTVKNVSLNADINETTADSVGAAVAVLCGGGTVEGVSVSGTVTGIKGVGGVVGRMLVEGTITGCTNSAAVTQTGDSDSAGGIVGKAYYTEAGKEMTISDCTNSGVVTSTYAAGGIAGFSAANVTGCENTANITAGMEAGGIVGEQVNYGEVSNNTNSGAISAIKAGGIIGWIRYQNNDSYANSEVIVVSGNTNSGTITGTGDVTEQSSAGGIVGLAYNQAHVTNNTNSADTISAATFAAGIVGAIQQENNNLDMDGEKFVITNNATTTTLESITANCKDLYVYNNDPNNPDFATIEGNGSVFVAEINGVKYTELADAIAAAEAGDTVSMVADVTESAAGNSGYGLAGIMHNNGCTIDGNGHTLTVEGANTTWDCAIYTKGGTIKNLTIAGAFRGIFTGGLTQDLYVDNCVIDNVCYTFNADGSGDYDVVFTNTTLNGWTSYTSGFQSVSFTDCTFGKGTGGYQYAYLRPYSDTTITNCAFSEGFELDATQTDVVALNDCTVGGVDLTINNLTELLGEGAASAIVNGLKFLADGLAMDEDGNYVVTNANGLAAVNSLVGVSGCGDQTVILSADTTYDMTGVDWTPITVQGYTGAGIITVQGNGATITNLSAPLFAGGFAGESGIVISDLTIADSQITSTSDQGSGAFIECIDSMETITLTNCRLENVTLTGSRTGGLIGWTSGYNKVNDGPVKTVVTITDCSVVDCAISGTGSVGGIIGHAGANPWTFQTITNCTVEDTTLTSSDDGDIRVGTIVGTANVGELTITDCTATDVTLTQNGQSVDEKAYGRFVPGETGKLVIDGVLITNETISGADGLAAALESVSSMTGEVTLSVEGAELGWVTGAAHGSTPFLGEDATVETVVIDGGENGATLTATGDGVGPIRAANGGTLVFKNITFVDQSKSYAENAWEFAYLEMGGKLVFENCVFSDPIQLETGAEATFTDCSFEGKTVDGLTMYAVWVGGGSATFTGCTFEGTRGIKIHEAYGSNVTEVIIDGCTFDSLSEKPGVAIGTVDETTVITITDSEFINCQAGDQDMYIYETDTDVTTFDFTESGNTVE